MMSTKQISDGIQIQWRIRNNKIEYAAGERDIDIEIGQTIMFDVDMVTRVSSGSQKKYVIGEQRRQEWFDRRFPIVSGITPIAFENSPIFSKIDRKSEIFSKPAARFHGIGIVTDLDLFVHAINNGIGPAKTFGYGFLTFESI